MAENQKPERPPIGGRGQGNGPCGLGLGLGRAKGGRGHGGRCHGEHQKGGGRPRGHGRGQQSCRTEDITDIYALNERIKLLEQHLDSAKKRLTLLSDEEAKDSQ